MKTPASTIISIPAVRRVRWRAAWAVGSLALVHALSVHAQTPPLTPPVTQPALPAPTSPTAPLAPLTPQVQSVSPSPIDDRWRASLDAFAAEDRLRAPTEGGVLFVGSSSIRLWGDLERSFESQPVVIKRGFGGSRLSDCARYIDQLVLPYKPRLVVVYAGDNDLAEGATPQQVLTHFRTFVEGVHAQLPQTRIAFLSIKPSPLRASLMPAVREANALIQAYSATRPNLDYIDIYTKMLTEDGRPRTELYGPDSLHLSAEGYALWKMQISPHLLR